MNRNGVKRLLNNIAASIFWPRMLWMLVSIEIFVIGAVANSVMGEWDMVAGQGIFTWITLPLSIFFLSFPVVVIFLLILTGVEKVWRAPSRLRTVVKMGLLFVIWLFTAASILSEYLVYLGNTWLWYEPYFFFLHGWGHLSVVLAVLACFWDRKHYSIQWLKRLFVKKASSA